MPSIDIVNSYPVSAGASVSFMHENKPYMFVKTAPSSPLEAPTISIFKITKVDSMDETDSESSPEFVTRDEYILLKEEIQKLEERINNEPVFRKSKRKWNDKSNAASSDASNKPNKFNK